jgi:predicted DNA-binding mobile mystery protein A
MATIRSAARQRLDRRLEGLGTRIGPRPPRGWVREIRLALMMRGWDLGTRLGVTASRVAQIEVAEVEGSLRLGSLRRIAEAMNCQLYYVFVPDEPLDVMVRRQAERRALVRLLTLTPDKEQSWDRPPESRIPEEQINALADQMAERFGLWGDPLSR